MEPRRRPTEVGLQRDGDTEIMTSFAQIGSFLTALSFVVAPALAVEKSPAKPSHVTAKHETKKMEEGKEMTMTGKVVDLANYTTGTSCSDHARCAECIRAGVPCALETSKGLVLLDKGP